MIWGSWTFTLSRLPGALIKKSLLTPSVLRQSLEKGHFSSFLNYVEGSLHNNKKNLVEKKYFNLIKEFFIMPKGMAL